MDFSLPYIAGFFDGEGCVGIYKDNSRGHFFLRTQLVQNDSQPVQELFKFLCEKYGGNASSTKTTTGKVKLNWQLNSKKAVRFLSDILPYLNLKKEQAYFAIAWQEQRPPITRDKKGRVRKRLDKNNEFDQKVLTLIRELKHHDIQTVMDNQADLVEIVARLKQVICVKG